MSCTSGYNLLDNGRNEDTLDELKTDPVERKLAQHEQKWLNQVGRMEDINCPKQDLVY